MKPRNSFSVNEEPPASISSGNGSGNGGVNKHSKFRISASLVDFYLVEKRTYFFLKMKVKLQEGQDIVVQIYTYFNDFQLYCSGPETTLQVKLHSHMKLAVIIVPILMPGNKVMKRHQDTNDRLPA